MKIPINALLVGTLAIVIQTVSGRCPSLDKWTKKSDNGEINYSAPPAVGKNKNAEYDTDVKATYTCIEGYKLEPEPKNGKGVRKCHKKGYWTELDYACISDTSLLDDTLEGKRMRSGKTILPKLLPIRQLDRKEGKRKEKVIIGGFGRGPCGAPPVIQNGNIAWAADDMSAVRYTCKSGYRMEGMELLTCEMRGWNPRSAPTCKAMDSCRKNLCFNGGTCWLNPTVKEGFQCECPPGHFKGLRCERTKRSTKKGLAVSLSKIKDCRDFDVFKDINWWYDWALTPRETKGKIIENLRGQECKASELANLGERVPMIFSLHHRIDPSSLAKNLINTGPGESEYLLGFNEPNHKGQANIDPKVAALLWRGVVDVAAKQAGKKLVSPSASICGENNATCSLNVLEWFTLFLDYCYKCNIDYLATHYFGCNATLVMTYLQRLRDEYNKEIWLTELSCPREDDPKVQLEFMKEILPKLEAAPWINRYAWYTWRLGSGETYIKKGASLLHETIPQLTELGRYFDSYEPHI